MLGQPLAPGPGPEPAPPQPPNSLGARLLRGACLGLVRLFYREIHVAGAERLPAEGPWLIACNHPNGLLDPLVLRLGLHRPVGFLAKSTLFGNPIGRAAMEAFGALKAFRQSDGQDTSKNEQSFEHCRALLRGGGYLCLFPEGVSHSDPALRPLKTGAARIALSYQQQRLEKGGPPLWLVPAGLTYSAKETFRSTAAVTVGQPIDVAAFADQHGSDPAAARALTELLQQRLAESVLQADSQALWRGLLAVAAWTDPQAAGDLALRQRRAHRLAERWGQLSASDPPAAEALQQQAQAFVHALQALDLGDPLALEDPPLTPARLLPPLASLLLLLPLAAVGALLGWLPYRAVRPAALKLAGSETDLVSTIKVLLGALALTLWWAAEAALAGGLAGWPLGLAVALLGPLGGWVALRWSDRLETRRDALRAAWLTLRHDAVAAELRQRRAELAAAVEAALGRPEGQ